MATQERKGSPDFSFGAFRGAISFDRVHSSKPGNQKRSFNITGKSSETLSKKFFSELLQYQECVNVEIVIVD